MRLSRLPKITPCVLAVMLLWAPMASPARAEGPEEGVDAAGVDRALRTLLRQRLPLKDRLRAAREALSGPPAADAETAAEAGLSLAQDAPEIGLWLVLRARDEAFFTDDLMARGRARLEEVLGKGTASAADRAAQAAMGLLFGLRSEGSTEALGASWPLTPAVAATLRRDLLVPAPSLEAALTAKDATDLVRTVAYLTPLLTALDQAERDAVALQKKGLDQLANRGEAAVVALTEALRRQVETERPGRMLRAIQAATVLGVLGDRRATPVLVRALEAPNGWLQAAAATALGDLQDPAAVVPLAHKIFYRGDILRPRDGWDWPGDSATTVSREDWPTVEYFVVDCLVGDALLRLGVPGAAGFLIHQKLDPSKANYRIRVLQDALDALRRVLPPDAPLAAYDVDAGLPQRRRAFDALALWWNARRYDVAPKLDESDPGFRREARRMVERLRGRSIMELQISQETCDLLGASVTPTLAETLGATRNNAFRTEIARALGHVRDPRAIDPLLALLSESTPFVRATAADALGSYTGAHTDRARAVEARLIRLLDDPAPEVRVAAMKALAAAPPRKEVLEAVRAHGYALFRGKFKADDREYRMAETVALLIQEGEKHWPLVAEGLRDDHRYVRSAWWELLRRALRLPPHLYNAIPQPDDEAWRTIDEARVLETLRQRRTP